jgi:hypothetical protein
MLSIFIEAVTRKIELFRTEPMYSSMILGSIGMGGGWGCTVLAVLIEDESDMLNPVTDLAYLVSADPASASNGFCSLIVSSLEPPLIRKEAFRVSSLDNVSVSYFHTGFCS